MATTFRVPLSSIVVIAAMLSFAAPAEASSPSEIYVYPTRVDMLPSDSTANQVVIHGAFFFWQTGSTYSMPMCGYMYFQCPAGQESMCRMQWTEIRNGIGGNLCQGFGAQQMVTKATLRAPGAPLGTPDPWNLGIGITPGSYVDGKCDPAKMLGCKMPPMPDMMMPMPDMAKPPMPDMAKPPMPDMATANIDMAVPAPDLAVSPKPSTSCAVAGHGGGAGAPAWLLAGLLGFGVTLRRRRR